MGAHIGKLVLVIDDDSALRAVTARLLTKLGYATAEARDGMEGLKLLQPGAAQVLLAVIDMEMPGWNGEQTLAALRQLAPELPAVLMSGYPLAASRIDSGDGPPTVFLEKPFTLSGMRTAVEQALGGAGGLPPTTTRSL